MPIAGEALEQIARSYLLEHLAVDPAGVFPVGAVGVVHGVPGFRRMETVENGAYLAVALVGAQHPLRLRQAEDQRIGRVVPDAVPHDLRLHAVKLAQRLAIGDFRDWSFDVIRAGVG